MSAKDGGLQVAFKDHILGEQCVMEADQVILSAGLRPNETDELASLMKLARNPEGYLLEAHVKLRPVDMATERGSMSAARPTDPSSSPRRSARPRPRPPGRRCCSPRRS